MKRRRRHERVDRPPSHHPIHNRPRIIFILEQNPIRVHPFAQPIDREEVGLRDDDIVDLSWRMQAVAVGEEGGRSGFGEGRGKHGGEVV